MISELMNRHAKLALCIFTAFLALLFCVNIDGYAYDDITGHFTFTVDGSGGATITGGDNAVIPETVSRKEKNGSEYVVYSYPVTCIGASAFYECSGLTGNLTIPSSVTVIGDSAFYCCSGLTGGLTIPSSVTVIGDRAFCGCSGLTGDLTIPNSVSVIGEGTFSYCSGLTGNLTIPSSVTVIGDSAFWGCSGLTGDLTIPSSVTEIGSHAFYGCSGFTGNLTISTGVTEIGAYTFRNCSGLTSNLIIPNGVTKIGRYAFGNCCGLTGNLIIPNGVTKIESRAFFNCKGLTGNLNLPAGVTEIEEYAFSGCSSLTGNLTLPSSLTEIGEFTFSDCSGLTGDLTIPSGVTEIGSHAFYGCSGLTGILTIPSSVTEICEYSFAYCSSLKHVYFQGDAPTIADDAFTECTLYGHHPQDNGTWTTDKLQDYGGDITWELTLSRYQSVIPSNRYSYRSISIVPEYSQNIKIYCYETDELLVQDRDYTVEYSDPVNVGTCTVTVRGINGYDGINGEPSGSLYAGDGSLQGSFSIIQRSLTNRATITLSEATVALEDGEYLYTGGEICPEITVTCYMDDDHWVYSGMTDWPYAGNITLTKDKDYTVTYINNTEPGDAKIIVEGIGNFSSTVTAEFKILPTIKLPSSVTEINSQAFCNTAAEAIIIPQRCQYIAADAFTNCTNLKYIINYSSVSLSSIDGVSVYNVCETPPAEDKEDRDTEIEIIKN